MELIVCLRAYRENFYFEEFEDADDILALVESGSFYLSDGSSECTVNAKDATLFKKNKKYFRKVISPVTMYLFRLKSKKDIDVGLKMEFVDKGRIESDLNLLKKLDNGFYADDLKYRKLILEDIFMQYFLENSQFGFRETNSDPEIQKAINMIKADLHKKIDLTYIAQCVDLSYVHFLRRFKKYTFLTPSQYIAKERMRLAKEFLTNTDMLIRDIAPVCGFENEYYFSNFFKNNIGISPSEFRKSAMR